jgi:hypothetical protein
MMRVACLVLAGLLSACGTSTISAGSPSASLAPSEASGPPASQAEGMIPDPSGDALLISAPGYVDARSAGVVVAGGTFSFAVTLAGPIPTSFKVPAGWDALLWSFCLDTDNSSDPRGYPFEPSTAVPCEFIVTALSKGSGVTGTLIDRRPSLEVKPAATTSIPVALDGTTVTISVPAAKLGHPARFTWVMATTALTLPWPNDEFLDIDEVPDSSFGRPAPWPAS